VEIINEEKQIIGVIDIEIIISTALKLHQGIVEESF
jgi:hypothetical protein